MRCLAAALFGIAAASCNADRATSETDRNVDASATASLNTEGTSSKSKEVRITSEPVLFRTRDMVTVYGRYYRSPSKPKGVILLFHQAGSNKAEYGTIAPRLARAGYDAVAIDQRSGGDMFGAKNETVDALRQSRSYIEALPDLEIALAWARQKNLPVIAWGSSYSAALAILLAARHPADVAAVFAFSPGEYLEGISVKREAAKVKAPMLLMHKDDPGEIKEGLDIAEAAPGRPQMTGILEGGVHGSSALIAERNPRGAERNWEAVISFLERLESGEPD